MKEPTPSRADFLGASSSGDQSPDVATAQQLACLDYLDIAVSRPLTLGQANTLLSRAEADPAYQGKLRIWEQQKARLHPDLYPPQARSYKEARQWLALLTGDSIYGYDFRAPTASQTMVVLESLDRQEAGWDRGDKTYRELRFMNELATLSPELCKPGCSFPRALERREDFLPSDPAASGPSVPMPPSTPSFPGLGTATAFVQRQGPSSPGWQPPTLPAALPSHAEATSPAGRKGGLLGWVVLLLFLALGAAVFAVFGGHASPAASGSATAQDQPSKDQPSASPVTVAAASTPSSHGAAASPPPPVAAKESQQRALKKYPDLAKTGSPLNKKFVAAYQQLQATGSPRLQQPDWPERLADECAGVSSPSPSTAPKTAAASSPSPATQNAAPPAPVSPTANPPAPVPAVAVAPTATPNPSPAGIPFVTLDAVNKTRMNSYKYSWSPYYYADYDLSFKQAVGIEVKVHNMTQKPATVNLRWMFFGRRTSSNERYVFSASQKKLELTSGQTISDVLDSPMLQSSAAVSYSYGTHYYSGSKYEGWLVQILPDGGDQIIRQVGSSGYLEDYGKRGDLTELLKNQLKR